MKGSEHQRTGRATAFPVQSCNQGWGPGGDGWAGEGSVREDWFWGSQREADPGPSSWKVTSAGLAAE